MRAVSAAEIRRIDQEATRRYAIPSLLLMENAGLQVVRAMEREFPALGAMKVVVVCGHGNNGGDGFVAARHLALRGVGVRVLLLAPRDRPQGDAATNLGILSRLGIPIQEILTPPDLGQMSSALEGCDLLVDAILGTGISPPVRGIQREVIAFLLRLGKPVVAVDIPSGLSSDDGRISGEVMRANLTVTFGLPKIGHFLFPAAGRVGRLVVAGIGYPKALVEEGPPGVELIDESVVGPLLPPRAADSHKGTFGHVLVVAGARGKSGASALCALGGLRSGAGLVTLATPGSLQDVVAGKLTEVMTAPLPETEEGAPAASAAGTVLELLRGKNVLVLGPGIGTAEETARMVAELVEKSPVPLVIDADGLNCLASHPETLRRARVPVIVTPHPGEMSRMSGKSTAEVQAARLDAPREFARTYGVTVVLKGAHTVTAQGSGDVHLNLSGNPGMATGGSGDVLTGVVGGLLAQGLDPADAARAGVYLHGLAGDLAAGERGAVGLIAGDLLDQIPRAIRLVAEGPFPEDLRRVTFFA